MAFHGGVAYNQGMVRAFRELLELAPEDFLVPEHAATAGAVGAALLARKAGPRGSALPLSALRDYLAQPPEEGRAHPPLPDPGPPPGSHLAEVAEGELLDAYLGVDVGSISTNVVLIDAEKRVLAKSYLMTAGRPIEAVRQGLSAVGEVWASRVNVRGVCTTGFGALPHRRLPRRGPGEKRNHRAGACRRGDRPAGGYHLRDRRAGFEIHQPGRRRHHRLRDE